MGTLIIWDDKYNTGNFVIDYQHQRLVRLINDLYDVQKHEELKPSLLSIILDEVAHYTSYHFKTEEEIMEQVNYSDLADHKILHQAFVKQVAFFKAEYAKGNKNIDSDFCQYLKDWLINHIATEDLKMMSELTLGQGVA